MIGLSAVSQVFSTKKGTVEALRDINLTINSGEFVAVIGRSGCGKSTLLRLIAGLLKPTGGAVSVCGDAVVKPRSDVSMMFQRPALLPWRSVFSNVLLPIEMRGGKRSAHKAHADELLRTVGLADFRNRLPHELSGGMQQRVALCRALIERPRILLMDEPFSALDALTREELSDELQRIHSELRATTVFVTHSIQEAVLLADRVVVLAARPGRIREVIDVKIPRPRSFTHSSHLAEVSELVADLHELLLESQAGPDLTKRGPGITA